jgi:actinin alpha
MTRRADGLLPRTWEETQISTFTKWGNVKLKARDIQIESVTTGFSDGVHLIELLEIVSDQPIGGRWHQAPKQRVQMLENCNLAIQFITAKMGIKLVAIGGLDIVDRSTKLTLGLIWSVIAKCHIETIMQTAVSEGQTARDALLEWCRTSTAGYAGVTINDFSASWRSGLAIAALMHKYLPAVINYESLNPDDEPATVTTALEACRTAEMAVYLDPVDLIGVERPDEKAVITQVAELYKCLSDPDWVRDLYARLLRPGRSTSGFKS